MATGRNVPSSRTGHMAVCVDEYLLVFAGYHRPETDVVDEKYLPPNDIWVYHTELQQWSQLKAGGLTLPGLSGSASYLVDKNIYVFGGHVEHYNINDVYKLNLQQLQWSKVVTEGPEPSPRDKFSSWEYCESLYCFGGFGVPISRHHLHDCGNFYEDSTSFDVRGWNNQLVVFDTKTDRWSNPKCKGTVPSARAAHGAARIKNEVYIFGGRHLSNRLNDLHRLDLDNLTWSGPLHTCSDIPCGRSWHTFTALSSSSIFLYGGYTQDGQTMSDAWLLDVDRLQWTQLDVPVNRPRLWHTTCYCSSGEMLVFGGCSNDILSFNDATLHSNELLIYRFLPKRLVRMCLEEVYKHKEKTEAMWEFLPRNLQHWLNMKLKGDTCVLVESNNTDDKKNQQCQVVSTCALS